MARHCCPVGVRRVAGDFRRGDVALVCNEAGDALAHGLAQYNAQDSARITGQHSRDIERVLGFRYDEAMIHGDGSGFAATGRNRMSGGAQSGRPRGRRRV